MSWNDLDKGPMGQESSRFLSIPTDETITVRALDEEPFTVWQHRVSQMVGGQEQYRTIPATGSLDDNFVQKNTDRYPAQPNFNLRVIRIEDGEPIGDIQILSGGKQIFKPMRDVAERHGSITRFDFDIRKTGKGRDTSYSVMLAASHAELVGVWDDLQEEKEGDFALQWENVFYVPTEEQQQRLFEEAGFDVSYDPAEKLVQEMSVEEALVVRMPSKGGKYPSKTMRELVTIDLGYLQWVANKYQSDDTVTAAARLVTRNLSDIGKIGGAKPAQSLEEKPIKRPRKVVGNGSSSASTKVVETPTKVVETPTEDRGAIVKEINNLMIDQPEYEDTSAIVKLIKEHSGGKTRIRDMDMGQLVSMRDALLDTAGPF